MKRPEKEMFPLCMGCHGTGCTWLKAARGAIRRICEKCDGTGVVVKEKK